MKTILLIFALSAVAAFAPPPDTPMPCAGAMHANAKYAAVMAQERHTPPGQWCQRPTKDMSKKAVPCACHKHDCLDPDPNHVSAHTDKECENYCNTKDCLCGIHDCP